MYNFKSIEESLISHIGDGKEKYLDINEQSRTYITGLLVSDQYIDKQMEIINEASVDNNELAHPTLSYMMMGHLAERAARLRAEDITNYMEEDLTEEFDRLFTKYHSTEEREKRIADLEKEL